MASESFRKLDAWRLAVDLSVEIYRATESFPRSEQFGLTSQIRRAAISVSSNIAEGRGRQTDDSFAYFLRVANGSLYEVESQLLVAERLGYLGSADCRKLLGETERVAGLIQGLLRFLASVNKTPPTAP